MRKLKRLVITLYIGLALLTQAMPALAESLAQTQSPAVTLARVAIELWPEYDRPTMLVQISGTLDSSVALPTQVVVRLPAASGGPLAVATRTATGSLLNAPYTTAVSGDQILVTLQADVADFHIEYYDPTLAITGTARTFAFNWTTDYAVTEASVRVQAPVDSSQLTGDPPLAPAGIGDDGLNYYTAPLGALKAGQQVSLRLTYAKSSSTLSSTRVAANTASAAQAAPTASPAPALTFASPWLWGGVGALLVVVGVVVWALWQMRASQQREQRVSSRRRRPVRASRAQRGGLLADSSLSEPAASFCTQCGQALLPGDRFCRKCGTPIRE